MELDTTSILLVVLAGLALWQQWNLMQLQRDLDDVIDSHNDFVVAMLDLLREGAHNELRR